MTGQSQPSELAFLLTEPAAPDRPNEDAAAHAGAVAVLADGAGVPARFRAGCVHTVAWYSHALVAALVRELADPAAEMREALARAIAAVRDLHGGTCDLEAGSPSATVVAVRARGDLLEHLVLCDSSLLLARRDGSSARLTDLRVDAVVAQERTPEAIEARRNAPGGFWVARHEPEAAREALVGAEPLAAVQRVALVSDGVTRAVDLLGLCGDADLAARCSDPVSAASLLTEIRREEGRRAGRGQLGVQKVHDDATVLGWGSGW